VNERFAFKYLAWWTWLKKIILSSKVWPMILMKIFFLFALVSKESSSSLLSSASSHLPRIWFYSPNKCSPFISVHSSIPCKSSGLTQPKTARGFEREVCSLEFQKHFNWSSSQVILFPQHKEWRNYIYFPS